MSNIIKIKRSSLTSAPGSLANGELAYVYGTGTTANGGDRIYIGTGTEVAGSAANVEVIGGKYFTDMLSGTHGVASVSSAIITDADGKISQVKSGDIKVTGSSNTIESTSGNLNLTAAGLISISGAYTLPKVDGNALTSDGTNTTVQQALITDGSGSVTWQSLSQVLSIAADTGTDNVSLLNNVLTVTGGIGIDTTVTDNKVTIDLNQEQVEDFIDGLIGTADGIVKTYTDASNTLVLSLQNSSIANAKLQNPIFTIGSDVHTLGGTITDISGLTSLDVDNITIDGNQISSTDTNGSIEIAPDGTGSVTVPSGYEARSGFGSTSLTNKAYVDSIANGLAVKAACRAGTTANLASAYNNGAGTLTASSNAALVIDAVTLVVGNRVLVKDQTNAVQNGFYEVTNTGSAGSAWVLTRSADANEDSNDAFLAEITGGAFTFVEEGTLNADNGYVCTQNGAITLGTTTVTFEQFSGAGQISPGAALSKIGNTIDVEVDDSSIEVVSDALQVKAQGITNSMILDDTINIQHKMVPVTTNRLMVSNGTGEIIVLATASQGKVLVSQGSGTPTWEDIDGGTF